MEKKLTAEKNLNLEKIGLNRASPQPDRAGIGLVLFSPIGLAKIGLSPIRAGCFRAGPVCDSGNGRKKKCLVASAWDRF